jgi:hypothetical protein
MRTVWRQLNESIEGRPAWQEALIVGAAVGIALGLLNVAQGHSLGQIAGIGTVGGIGSAVGVLIARPLRARRRARRLKSN